MSEYELIYFDERQDNFMGSTSTLYKTEIEAIDSIEHQTVEWVGYGSNSPHYNHIFIVKEYHEDYESSIGKEIARYNQDGVKIWPGHKDVEIRQTLQGTESTGRYVCARTARIASQNSKTKFSTFRQVKERRPQVQTVQKET